MRAFISHTFAESDVSLAVELSGALKAVGGSGYMAEEHLEYDLLIHEKIKSAIVDSDYLVAIITKNGQASPSVHEEIGYALGREVPVLIMLERGVEMRGVFAHGKEPEVFDRNQFDAHAGNVVDYMRRHYTGPRGRVGPEDGKAGAALLKRRKMDDADSDKFAHNEYYRLLYSRTMSGHAKHAVLFTACPRRLETHADVADEAFEKWVNGRRNSAEPGNASLIRGQYVERDMDSLVFYDKRNGAPDGPNVMSYCEFRNDGYFEMGTASRYTYREGNEQALHLCHVIGDFGWFFEEVKKFYKKIDFDGPFDSLLSIGNSSGLVLGNLGNEALRADYYGSQEHREMLGALRRSRRKNLQVSHGFDGVGDLTDARIRDAAHDAATKIAHAYGQKRAKCFDENGNFTQELWRKVHGKSP